MLSLREPPPKPVIKKNALRLFSSKKLSHDEILALTQQMSSMLKAGLPLDKALSILLEINQQSLMQRTLLNLQHDVRSGNDFADSLQATAQFRSFLYQYGTGQVKQGDLSVMP